MALAIVKEQWVPFIHRLASRPCLRPVDSFIRQVLFVYSVSGTFWVLWRNQRIHLTSQSFCSRAEIDSKGVKEVKTGPITVSVGKGFMQQPLGGRLQRNHRLGSSFVCVCGGGGGLGEQCLNLKWLPGSLLGEEWGHLVWEHGNMKTGSSGYNFFTQLSDDFFRRNS